MTDIQNVCIGLANKLYKILKIILLAVFLPVLICVVFIGNHMDYNEGMKIITRLPNQVLFIIALLGLMICIFLFWKCSGLKISLRANWAVNCVLVGLFTALYFVNVRVAKEIAFYIPWDIGVVRAIAFELADDQLLGYHYYFSMYSNNIPIVYILEKLYRMAMEIQDYPYNFDFIWLQVNCALISIAGFFSCLTIKKLTKKLMPVAAVFFLYLVLVGISPWKIAPYTDTYGLIFPVMCVYFYTCYRNTERVVNKFIYIFLSIASGMCGGFVKPNLYIVIIALLGNELLCFLADYKKRWKYILTEIILMMLLAWGNEVYLDHIIDEIGLEFNEEIEAGWQHYFYMGLNEATTGGYFSDDVTLFGEFQYSRSDRIHAELERAAGRLKDRGFLGSIYFYLRKLVMTFNDGLFGWRTEVWDSDAYPESMSGNTYITLRLRSIFWGSEINNDAVNYNTLCQLVWIFCILGIPGICLCKNEKGEESGFLILCFLGIFFYQMLFEARARYLFVFLPIILPIAICGIQEYTYRVISAFLKKGKSVRNFS